MNWKEQLKEDSLPWLLQDDSPGVRYLALRDLFERSEDDGELCSARKKAHAQGPIATVLDAMHEQGYWIKPGAGYNPKYRSTVWALILLAQLGATIEEDERIGQACKYLLDNSLASGGQFSTTGAPSGTIACLQGNLCRALNDLGCDDPRLVDAYHWMARSVTGEGLAPVDDRQSPSRYYAYHCGPTFACGPNQKQSCAWGATKVMLALARWRGDAQDPLIKNAISHGVNFLFSTDPADAEYPSGLNDKPSRNWWKFGFPVFYVTDILQLAQALTELGYGGDQRISSALSLVRGQQDEHGRWSLDYDYRGKTWLDFGEKKQPNKWVTYRALRVLKASFSV